MARSEDLTADSAYDYRNLSRVEKDALVAALGDGFGQLDEGAASGPLPLPTGLDPGLLDHHFFFRWEASEFAADDSSAREFWHHFDRYDGPALDWFPAQFRSLRLQRYFQNQFDRFCAQVAKDNPDFVKKKGPVKRLRKQGFFEWVAARQFYRKPWYEFHALNFCTEIAEIEESRGSSYSYLDLMCLGQCAGRLGRLVEQYYWRFVFESAAVTGVRARSGASAGGKARAQLHQRKRDTWQRAASEIWNRHPELSKNAVADRVKRRLGVEHTPKHIARNIVRA